MDPMATLSADEASHWDLPHAGWTVERVNLSAVCSDHGKHSNRAESHFPRPRRMVVGQHHHVSPQYLHQYANQAAWLDYNRCTSNGGLAHGLVAMPTYGGRLDSLLGLWYQKSWGGQVTTPAAPFWTPTVDGPRKCDHP